MANALNPMNKTDGTRPIFGHATAGALWLSADSNFKALFAESRLSCRDRQRVVADRSQSIKSRKQKKGLTCNEAGWR